MPRKPYAQLVKQGVKELHDSKAVMLRMGQDRPSHLELGDVFEHIYTTIEEEGDCSIIRAFDACDLSLDNPFHWENLMRVFCDLHFPKRKTKKTKRTAEFFAALKHDRAAVRKKHGKLGPTKERKHLMVMFPDRYGKNIRNENTLRRIITELYSKSGRNRKRRSPR